jgi:hypothetical protein
MAVYNGVYSTALSRRCRSKPRTREAAVYGGPLEARHSSKERRSVWPFLPTPRGSISVRFLWAPDTSQRPKFIVQAFPVKLVSTPLTGQHTGTGSLMRNPFPPSTALKAGYELNLPQSEYARLGQWARLPPLTGPFAPSPLGGNCARDLRAPRGANFRLRSERKKAGTVDEVRSAAYSN